MRKHVSVLTDITLFAAGVLVGGWARGHRDLVAPQAPPRVPDSVPSDLHRALVDLAARVAAEESANAQRCADLEARLNEHSAKLSQVPSLQHFTSTMEQLLAKTLQSLDDRFTTQARSIEGLKATVSRTDNLIERVLTATKDLSGL